MVRLETRICKILKFRRLWNLEFLKTLPYSFPSSSSSCYLPLSNQRLSKSKRRKGDSSIPEPSSIRLRTMKLSKADTAPEKKILSEKALCKRVKKFELQELEKTSLSPEGLSAMQTLLNDVFLALRPKPNDYKLRGELVQIFNLLVKEVLGSNNGFPIVEAFGSFIMDIFTAKSDLDLSINFCKDETAFPRDRIVSVLKTFARRLYALQSRGHVFGVQSILRARVPILKVVDCGTGIECDISVENKDGMARSKILAIISTIDERFRKLSFMMKAWAKAQGINSSKDRTLNSLSIISLVAFHLQTRTPPIFPPFSALFKDGTDISSLETVVRGFQQFGRENKESLALLFVTLLIKLSSVETLWPRGLCASTLEGSWISKTWNSEVGNISVEDFTDRSQNFARSVGKAEVQKIYQCIHESLQYMLSFMMGQIQAPKLKALLFGPDASLSGEQVINNATVNLKRKFPFHDSMAPLNPIPPKRLHYTEASGANKAYGENPCNAAPSSTFIPPPSSLPQWGYGSHPQIGQATPTGFETSHGPNPTAQMPHDGLGPIQTGYIDNQGSWSLRPQGLQQPPLVFDGSHGPNPMAQIHSIGQGHIPSEHGHSSGQLPH